MVTQTIHIGDCELLEYYMDVTDGANPKWDNGKREWLIDLGRSPHLPQPLFRRYAQQRRVRERLARPDPLALNPFFGAEGAGTERMDPAVMAQVKWTHYDDLRNCYGVEPNGYARQTGDDVGVQYGLQALREGKITAAEFLDLNAKVGSWKDPSDFGPGGRALPNPARSIHGAHATCGSRGRRRDAGAAP